ncbi:hypothetical protein KP509_06G039200 [Ceratopteris richardii]|nr:hypothetical protein KP509_06G039200 [Ceratopteris richardii]
MNNNSESVAKKKNKNKKWKNSKLKKNNGLSMGGKTGGVISNPLQNGLAMGNPVQNAMAMGNPSNNTLPLPVPHFVAPALPPAMSYAVQGPRMDPYFLMNAPLEARFTGHNYGIVSRNLPKKRRMLSKKKITSPFLHAPLAPRNTTSFIMRAKKLGGIAPAVTPSPATPAIFPTPLLSPGVRGDKGSLEDMNRELGVDGYGSMNGLIRLRSYEDRARDGSESESDVEQGDLMNEDHAVHSVERLEQRIDQGLSRFEMIYPSRSLELDGAPPRNLQNCVVSQERLITHLEEENLTLKERLFLVEQELIDLRQRVRDLEGLNNAGEQKEEQYEESCGDVSIP